MAMAEAMRHTISMVDSIRQLGVIRAMHVPFFVDNQPAVDMVRPLSGTELRKTRSKRTCVLLDLVVSC